MKSFILFILVFSIPSLSFAYGLVTVEKAKFSYRGEPKLIKSQVRCLSDNATVSYTQSYNKDGYLKSILMDNQHDSKKFHSLSHDTNVKLEYKNNEVANFESEKIDNKGDITKVAYQVLAYDKRGLPKQAKSTHSFYSPTGNGVNPTGPLFSKQSEGSGPYTEAMEKWHKSKKVAWHNYSHQNNLLVNKITMSGPFGEKIVQRKVYEYDDEGRILSITSENPKSKKLNVDLENFYHQDRLVKRQHNGITVEENIYNQQGFVEQRSLFTSLGIMSLKYDFKYQSYDECGNWQRSLILIVDAAAGFDDQGNMVNASQDALNPSRSKVMCPEVEIIQEFQYYTQCNTY